MLVRLIQPKTTRRPMDTGLKMRMAPQLGLLTIAGIIEDCGHKVELVNENIVLHTPCVGADLVGISASLDVIPRSYELARQYKKLGIPVTVGGIGITSDPDYAQQLFDTICLGPAEAYMKQLLLDAQNGQLKPIYRADNSFSGDKLLPPSFRSADVSGFLYSNVIATSRGCPFCCDFCYNSAVNGIYGYHHRTVASVMDEIRQKNTRHIMFIDDNFIGDPAFTRELLLEMAPLQLKWNAAVSANIGQMPELLDLMAETGCQSLFIGFESLNQASLRNVHKGQNQVDRYEHLVEALHSRGIMINASFVFGLDADDVGVFDRTADWIVKQRIETVTSHILTPYPGTALYGRMKAENRIIDDDFSHYDTAHVVFQPKNMSPRELYEGYLSIYRKVYSVTNIFRRIPRSPRQILPYLCFSFFYRKYGWLTEWGAALFGYHRIGKFARRMAYWIN